MNANKQQDRVQRFMAKNDISPFFFSNNKTQAAVDFRICPLMKKNDKGAYDSPVCFSCYSKNILSIYPALRNKVESLPTQTNKTLNDFDESCRLFKEEFGWDKLRFYALSDFSPKDIPYIKVAAKYFTVDIISKTLVMPKNEKHLVSLFDMENVWVSLSFNKNYTGQVDRIKKILTRHEPNNVNLNYTMKYDEENPMADEFDIYSIIHLRNDKKRKVMQATGLEESRVCGVIDINGEPVEGHGHCTSCNNCHVSTTTRLAIIA